jgi:uncharacterized membrane protein
LNGSALRYYWEILRTSYWFIPAVLGIAAIGLSAVTVAVDHTLQERGQWKDWTYTGGPEGARAVLATIAGSMITVAGVVFSITIVALSLASAQFGPRLLRNFIRDRRNQVVLGTFTATFLYCLLILRTVRGMDHQEFVPSVSVTVGMLLAITNLGILIYFIHHVAISIQATSVIKSVSDELHETIDRLWPDEMGEEAPEACELETPFHQAEAMAVLARGSGYVDAIQDSILIQLAAEHELVIRLAHRPGHFAIEHTPLAWAWPGDRVDEELTKKINKAFVLANHRTPFQDVEFAIDQLVEIAVRALSPGINDPFTALNCIDRLGEALCRLARRKIPSPLRLDDDQQLRVITYAARLPAVADAAFNQIRQYGAGSAAVLICLMETICVIASQCRRAEDLAAISRHAELVHRAAHRSLPEESDLADFDQRYEALQGNVGKLCEHGQGQSRGS